MPRSRRMTAAQVRDRRSKRIALVLGVVFIGVAAIQGPKLMKQLHHAAPAANDGVPSATPAAGTATTGAAPAPDAANTPTQIASFAQLKFKDPFHALVASSATSSGGAQSASKSSTDRTKSETGTPGSGRCAIVVSSSAEALVCQKKQTPQTQPAAQPQPTKPVATATVPTPPVAFTAAPPNGAVITMNGKPEIVAIGAGFPSAQPMFKLVSLVRSKKGIRLGVVGGSFADGVPTLLLLTGHEITLADQSDGSRYVLKLVRLTNEAPPPPKPGSTSSSQAPAAATTTTPSG